MTFAFRGTKYLSLKTFRTSGAGVATPVWFAAGANRTLYLYTRAAAGKVKRIRANPAVLIASCSARGTIAGPWVEARARIVSGEEEALGTALLTKKYWPWKSIGDFIARHTHNHPKVVIALSPANGAQFP